MNTLLYWLVHNSAAVAMMILAVILVCRLFRDGPAVQHLFWLVVLIKFVTPIVVSWPWVLDDFSAPIISAAAIGTESLLAAPNQSDLPALTQQDFARLRQGLLDNDVASSTTIPEERSWQDEGIRLYPILLNLLVFGWIVGAVVYLATQCRKIIHFHRIVNRAMVAPQLLLNRVDRVAARMGVTPPRVRVLGSIQSPMVWCLGQPVLLWPTSLLESTILEQADILIAHELAHLSRFDHWTMRLQLLARVIWWWNPLLGFVERRLNEAAENACDALALSAFTHQRREYAEFLLNLSCKSRSDRSLALLGIGGGSVRFFEQRLTLVLSDRVNCRTSLFGGAAVILFALVTFPGWSLAQQPLDNSSSAKKEATISSEDESSAGQPNAALRTIAGRVVDESGKPVDGAHIVWQINVGNPGNFVETTSDSEGRFSCASPDIKPKWSTWELDALWVFKRGKRLTTENVRRDGNNEAKLQQLEIRMLEDVVVDYTIVSADQTPVPDVTIEPWHFRAQGSYNIVPLSLRQLMTTKSDAEGRVRVSRFDQHTLLAVNAISDKGGTQRIRIDQDRFNEPNAKIELLPAGRVTGRLVAEDVELVKGIEVYVTTRAPNDRMDEGFALVKTDAEGHFDVPAIPFGLLTVDVMSNDVASELPRSQRDQLDPEETVEVIITYEPPVVVQGTVLTDDTNQPVPDAVIHLYHGTWQGATVVSDANGRYEARVLAGGVSAQLISIPKDFSSYVQLGAPWDERTEVPRDVKPFELAAIRLQPTEPLKGTVLLPNGKPAANLQMNAVHKNRRYGFTKTDERGEFSMPLPKTLKMDVIQIWFDDSKGPVDCIVEQKDPLILRAKK